jgi:ALG3 protein
MRVLTVRFLFAGILSLIGYGLLSIRYPLLDGLARPKVIWSSIVGRTPFDFAIHAATYLLLFLAYFLAIRTITKRNQVQQTPLLIRFIVVIWLGASGLLLLVAPGGESQDVFDYLYRGRLMAEYGVSPLAVSPDGIEPQLFYNYISWNGFVDTYGPLWEYASATVAGIIGSSLRFTSLQPPHSPGCFGTRPECSVLVAYITGYRLLAIALTGLSGWLIARIVQSINPAHVPLALTSWLWNPLVLIATALGAHNDAVLLPLLLASLLCFRYRRWVWGLVLLALAAHVKLTALLVLPILLIWLIWHTGWIGSIWRSAAALLISLPISWVLYTPLGGWHTLPRMLEERGRFLANSWPRVAYVALIDLYRWPEPAAWRLTTSTATIGFLSTAVILIVWRLQLLHLFSKHRQQQFSVTLLWQTIAEVTFCYLLVGSFWFQHWYLLWLIAPAVLLPTTRMAQQIIPLFSCSALCSNIIGDFTYQPIRTTTSRSESALVVTSIIWLPLLLYLGWWMARTLLNHLHMRRQRNLFTLP